MTTMASVGLPERKYDVQLIEKNRSHWYSVTTKDGKNRILPGVTGVLQVINKPALIPWAKKVTAEAIEAALMKRLAGKKEARIKLTPEWVAAVIAEGKARPDKIKDEAADLGTQAHQVFDRVVKGEKIDMKELPEILRPSVTSFLEWLAQAGIQLVMPDTKVASLSEGFGGSLDALGWKDDHYVLLDWKTSKGIYPEYGLQVAAYATAFEETFGVPIGEAHIVRFGKETPDWEHKRVANLTVSYGAFAAAKSLQSVLKDFQQYDD